MPDASLTSNVYAYIMSCVVTLVAILTAIWAYVVQRRRAMELDALEQRIPAAARYEHLQSLLAEAEAEWAALKDQLAAAKAVLAERDEAKIQLDELRKQLQSLEADRQQLQKLTAELEDVQRRHAEEYERHKELRKELDSAEFRVAKLKEEEQRLAPLVEGLRNQEKNLRVTVASLEAEKAKLEQQVASWRAQASEAKQETERLMGNRDILNKEVQEYGHQRAELTGDVSMLKKDKARLEVEAGKQKDRLADLWQPRLAPKQFDGVNTSGELEGLRNLGDYLRSLRLRFPARVLKAFHTSLKVAQVNPLVVLAGLSGTGKSELPRRYAEAFGMHFLNIAVQPRWDSPQDMFGFFNYMEGRYRATELARALVQMDRFCKEGGKVDASKQMLLVLLDEMNLARIEYYFSEFLSRLEIRRGINVENKEDRRKAEVPLEVGGVGGADSILPLFVDTNVLFVGTMNEDETTQTLSDKVVDRANILRFGKPLRLQDDGDGTRPISSRGASRQYMPYDAWKSWIKDPESMPADLDKKVSDWIDRLNEIMTLIRRPFAYRTRLAVRSYVANYPHEDHEQSVQWAVADQIEQKILPKFRGLDPSEPSVAKALSGLIDLLTQLDDHVLKEAVNDSRRAGEHLFQWQGVDRSKVEE